MAIYARLRKRRSNSCLGVVVIQDNVRSCVLARPDWKPLAAIGALADTDAVAAQGPMALSGHARNGDLPIGLPSPLHASQWTGPATADRSRRD
jgi:hypothetical protein